MANPENKGELNGKSCILAALIPLVILVIGMVLSIATGGATDNLLNIDSRDYGSSIFFGFWFLVAVGLVVFIRTFGLVINLYEIIFGLHIKRI